MVHNPRLELLVIQPTPFCNIDCDYCYLPMRSSTARMSADVLAALFTKLSESVLVQEQFKVLWHVGEPLTLPIGYYEQAFELIARLTPSGVAVTHCFQSNGILIDKQWCDFLAARSVKIGVSIDGPAFLHDQHRKTRSGRGTHALSLRGVRLLADHGIDCGVLTVLTREALKYPDEIYEFYIDNGISYVGFNVEESTGCHTRSSLNAAAVVAEYRGFLRRFFKLVERGGHVLAVRELDQARTRLRDRIAVGFNQEVSAWTILSVDHEGGFMTFSPELLGHSSLLYGQFLLGNVLQDSFAAAAASSKFATMYADVRAGVEACKQTCAYFSVCGGGSPANKLFENGSFFSTETLSCRLSSQAVMDIVHDFLDHDSVGEATRQMSLK